MQIGRYLGVLAAYCFVGMTVATLSAHFAIRFFSIANRILRRPLSPISVVTCAGGLAGYIPLAFPFLLDPPGTAGHLVFVFAIGPVFGLILGQTFARLGYKGPITSIQFQISTMLGFTLLCAVLQECTFPGPVHFSTR